MKAVLAVSLALLAWAPAGAGELIFANGSRLTGELSNESLMVSTGAGLVEIAPDEVVVLSREEIRLRDGRVISGTLVGGQVKARTSLGEIAVKVDELQTYRTSGPAGEPGVGAAQPAASQPGPTSVPAGSTPTSATPVAVSAARSDTGIVGGLPTIAAYQDASSGRQGNGTSPSSVQTASLTPSPSTPSASRLFEIVGESMLYRDALFSSSRVGRVMGGQQVKYVDSIDRRLRILNLLVFDGGHWVKIRLRDGTEGWVPADNVREVR
jgi:SH3 domain-containing protein